MCNYVSKFYGIMGPIVFIFESFYAVLLFLCTMCSYCFVCYDFVFIFLPWPKEAFRAIIVVFCDFPNSYLPDDRMTKKDNHNLLLILLMTWKIKKTAEICSLHPFELEIQKLSSENYTIICQSRIFFRCT